MKVYQFVIIKKTQVFTNVIIMVTTSSLNVLHGIFKIVTWFVLNSRFISVPPPPICFPVKELVHVGIFVFPVGQGSVLSDAH